ncbi:TerD family protein [Streptomyces sp. S-9]|uniref:TerD family protein n=1 Tax=Streptomyces sp. S-9 TaxID=2806600 RepID=UPI0035ABAF60
MSELVPGGNIRLPGGAVTVRVSGPFDVSALITDDGRKVSGDADFVFYNQPAAPGARLGGDTLVVDPAALRAGATRVTVAVSPEEPGTPLSALPAPVLEVTGPGGRALARFRPPRPDRETVLLLAEIYRRGDDFRLRALGQGYADGLAGLARDFGVDVEDDEGCFVYRTIEDLLAIEEYARRSTTGAVVGGGLLGLEAAGATSWPWSTPRAGPPARRR